MEYSFSAIPELLSLDDEQFLRMLPDLRAWHYYSRKIIPIGAKVVAFTWIDDGKPGNLDHVRITIEETGETIKVSP